MVAGWLCLCIDKNFDMSCHCHVFLKSYRIFIFRSVRKILRNFCCTSKTIRSPFSRCDLYQKQYVRQSVGSYCKVRISYAWFTNISQFITHITFFRRSSRDGTIFSKRDSSLTRVSFALFLTNTQLITVIQGDNIVVYRILKIKKFIFDYINTWINDRLCYVRHCNNVRSWLDLMLFVCVVWVYLCVSWKHNT